MGRIPVYSVSGFVRFHCTCKSVRRHVLCYCISKAKNEFGQNPEENIILTGLGQYTVILTGLLTKTNRENVNVKYNIIQLLHLNEINMRFYGAEYNNIERGEAEFNIVLCSIKPLII
jgi:hypothetical protein